MKSSTSSSVVLTNAGTVRFDTHGDAIPVGGDAREHQRGSELVSCKACEGDPLPRRDGLRDMDIETRMGPGADQIHALPAQQVLSAKEAEDLYLEESPDRARIPCRQRSPGLIPVPSPGRRDRMQVRMEPYPFAECVLDDDHRRSGAGSCGFLDEPRDSPVGRSPEIAHQRSVMPEIRPQHLGDGKDDLVMRNRCGTCLGEPSRPFFRAARPATGAEPARLAAEMQQSLRTRSPST